MELMRQKIQKFIAAYLDDILILTGIGCVSGGGFTVHIAAGLGLLGAGLIWFGILVAKGGARR
jgi:hypothetical protein